MIDSLALDPTLGATAVVPSGQAAATPPAQPVDDPLAGAPTIAELKRKYDAFRDATATAVIEQQRDRDYYDGPKQLNSEVRSTLKMRGQPAIYTNRVRPAIDGILGVLATAQTDPRAYPRNPSDDNAADVASKTLRYISDTNHFAEVKLDCAEDYLIQGVCAAIIEVGGDGTDVTVTQIPYTDFFYDPRSRHPDFKDAAYLGAAKWMYAVDVQAIYPERYAAMGDPVDGSINLMDSLTEDKPDNAKAWVDPKMRRLMVVEIYYLDGGWKRCVYCAAGVFEYADSPYNDDRGDPTCPVVASSCYIDRNLQRYGRVRDMRPIQDEINARRSRLLHLANSRQVQESQLGAGAGTSVDIVRTEAAKADGVIPTGWQMVPTADLAAGQQLLLAESKSEIERMGPTPAVLGRQGEAGQSGRARLVLQQAGMTELARPLGRFEDWENRCYQQMWFRPKQFWTGPKWVRVTDDVRAPQFIQINSADGKNQIAEMDMDIIIDSVPDTANLQQEIWGDLLELLKMYPPEDPRFTIAVEMSPIQDKQRILERIKAFKDEQAQQNQGQAQQAAQAAAAAMEKLTAEIADLKASALSKAATADKATVDANVAQTTAFATFGPVAAAFDIIPDAASVGHMQDRVAPGNAPQPTPGAQPFVSPAEQPPPQTQQPAPAAA